MTPPSLSHCVYASAVRPRLAQGDTSPGCGERLWVTADLKVSSRPAGPHPHPVPEAEGKPMALWPGRAWRASLQLRRWGDPQLWTRVLAHGCHLVMNTSSSSGWTRGSFFVF